MWGNAYICGDQEWRVLSWGSLANESSGVFPHRNTRRKNKAGHHSQVLLWRGGCNLLVSIVKIFKRLLSSDRILLKSPTHKAVAFLFLFSLLQPSDSRNTPGAMTDWANSASSSTVGFVAPEWWNILWRLTKLTFNESGLPLWESIFVSEAYLYHSSRAPILEDSVSYADVIVSLEESLGLSLGWRRWLGLNIEAQEDLWMTEKICGQWLELSDYEFLIWNRILVDTPSVHHKFYHSQLPYTWLDSRIYGTCLICLASVFMDPRAYVGSRHSLWIYLNQWGRESSPHIPYSPLTSILYFVLPSLTPTIKTNLYYPY